jgi:hypothetical protein
MPRLNALAVPSNLPLPSASTLGQNIKPGSEEAKDDDLLQESKLASPKPLTNEGILAAQKIAFHHQKTKS